MVQKLVRNLNQGERDTRKIPSRFWRALLLLAILAAYANHFHNSFHIDDGHTIVNNASIRELGTFRSSSVTHNFSALPRNQSYRPLVSTLLAIDYRLAHGLEPSGFICRSSRSSSHSRCSSHSSFIICSSATQPHHLTVDCARRHRVVRACPRKR